MQARARRALFRLQRLFQLDPVRPASGQIKFRPTVVQRDWRWRQNDARRSEVYVREHRPIPWDTERLASMPSWRCCRSHWLQLKLHRFLPRCWTRGTCSSTREPYRRAEALGHTSDRSIADDDDEEEAAQMTVSSGATLTVSQEHDRSRVPVVPCSAVVYPYKRTQLDPETPRPRDRVSVANDGAEGVLAFQQGQI